ncbi:hypothetical protein SLS60_003868 [Paraconiothyrium brasiliense]|uniref:Zn(2)-C6 fungal-type domain-containing protein n=1 Tax=Paraconiothyrium brasiliense TaxID=300254 RepID=A0ABR3RQR2_9PLEO
MRSAHRRSTAKHMKDRCWEKCDECAEAGLDRCDAAKGEGDCTNCRGREVACTKPPQGQVTTGGPTEVKSTGSVQSTQTQQQQQDGSQNAPDPRPRRLLRSRQDYAYSDDLDYEVTGSDSEEDLGEYGQDGEESHDTRGHVPSIRNDSPADAEIVEADQVLDNAESTELRLATDDIISSNATNQSQEHDLATTQAQPRQEHSHPGRSARQFFLNIDTAPGHPRTEDPPTKGNHMVMTRYSIPY